MSLATHWIATHAPRLRRGSHCTPGSGSSRAATVPPVSWTTLGSRLVYENPWIRVREDAVIRPDGQESIYGVVDTQSPSVFVVPVTARDEVVMVTQERYATGSVSLEIPAGGSDGDDPLIAAQRELREETGLVAASWRQLGRLEAMNGICSERQFVFLATDLAQRGGDKQAEDGITAVQTIPLDAVVRMIASGEISDGQTISSLALAAVALHRFA